jgi:hypothetical protein
MTIVLPSQLIRQAGSADSGRISLIQTEHDDERQNQPESRKNPA